MKIYTEEQVRKMLLQDNIFDIDDILDSEMPIELPTDEEIEKKHFPFPNKLIRQGCIEGAKWMKYIIIYKVDER